MPICPEGHDSATEDYCDTCGIKLAGAPESAGVAGSADGAGSAGGAESATTGAPPGPEETVLCPQCGTPKTGRFCEQDGYDFLAASLGGSATPEPGGTAPEGAPDTVAVPDTGTALDTDTDLETDTALETGAAAAGGAARPPVAAPAKEAAVVVVADPAYFEKVRAASGPDADTLRFPAYCPERRFGLRGEQVVIGRRSRSRGIAPDIDLVGPPEDPGVSHVHAMLVAQPDGGWAVVDLGSANGTYVNDSPDAIKENTPIPLKSGDHVHLGAWTKLTLRLPES
ncbi:MAG: FHA domain-containing protein [Micromonosporaceae bacterium]